MEEKKRQKIVPQTVINSILSIQFCPDMEDQPIWTPESSGKYTSKSAWQLVRKKKVITLSSSMTWHKKIPFKISFFMIRALHNKIPTDEAMKRVRISFYL